MAFCSSMCIEQQKSFYGVTESELSWGPFEMCPLEFVNEFKYE